MSPEYEAAIEIREALQTLDASFCDEMQQSRKQAAKDHEELVGAMVESAAVEPWIVAAAVAQGLLAQGGVAPSVFGLDEERVQYFGQAVWQITGAIIFAGRRWQLADHAAAQVFAKPDGVPPGAGRVE